jgi:hypothetical protein
VWDARTGAPLLELRGHTNLVTSAAFSPDGARVVTTSADRTAKVFDARAGIPLLELRGHTSGVMSAAFSPDGARIVTASGDRTAKVWDARTGAPLLELKGHTGMVLSAAFSPDGSHIITGSYVAGSADVAAADIAAKVWDARTGEEIKGEPVSPVPRARPISPDGRWIAHAVGHRVEVILLRPDSEEVAHRSLLMQPNFTRYREGYDAAIESKDDFAARFYLHLFPPPKQALIRAESIVKPLFARLLLRGDVLAALQAQPATDSEIQTACLKLAGSWPESSWDCNYTGWALVREPGQPDANYQRGLRLAKAACRAEPKSGACLNTLGVAQYRCGLMAEAVATLTRSNALNKEREPSDLALLALAQHRLGRTDKALATLSRLREIMKDPNQGRDPMARAFLREAEMIDLDLVFPADLFAP